MFWDNLQYKIAASLVTFLEQKESMSSAWEKGKEGSDKKILFAKNNCRF